MDIFDSIKGKTLLSFEVINTICSRILSVCISQLFPDNARLRVPKWCLLPSKEESNGTLWAWGLLSSKCYTFFLGHKTKNASQLLDYCQLHGAGHSDTEGQWNCVTQSSSSSDCSFSLPNQKGRMNYPHFLRNPNFPAHCLPLLPILTWTSHAGFPRHRTLTRNMNVPRSTENMLLFYWEVSDGSRRTLLKRHQLPANSKSTAHSAPWRMCVRLLQWRIPSSPLPGDAVSSSAGSYLPGAQGMFLTLCVLCWRRGETKDLDSLPIHSFNKYLLVSFCVHITLHQAVKGGRLVDKCRVLNHRGVWSGETGGKEQGRLVGV